MELSWDALVVAFSRLAPEGTPKRKLLQIVAIILLFEGISVLILFSYVGVPLGIFSLALGSLLLMLLHSGKALKEQAEREEPIVAESELTHKVDPPGIRLVDAIMVRLGSDYVVMAIGVVIIAFVLIYNRFFSLNQGLGDMDTLSLLFGGMVFVYPFVKAKAKVEGIFSLMFLGLVVLFLVVPQAVMSFRSEAGSSVGNWYVQYMLAAPFSGILNLLGIQASSSGSMVTIQFHDGTSQPLSISAYCAGLYSFSIFLAAFISFVLVFERLKTTTLVLVMGLGLFVAFLGNLFRMVIIGIVGYYWGIHALLWAHDNVGWMIFLSWSAAFWYLLLGYVSKHSVSASPRTEINQ